MIITRKKVHVKNKQWQHFLYASDLHLGEANCAIDAVRKDLKQARDLNARIIMPGDVFGMILPKDHKRYQPSCVVAELRHRDDQINASVDYAYEVLAPYADLIDVIGLGNHELAIKNHYSCDVTRLLVERLNYKMKRDGIDHAVCHGGITGYVQYSFCMTSTASKKPPSKLFNVLYHHGAGGDAPSTKGMNRSNRLRAQWVADVYVSGHNHWQWADKDVVMVPTISGKIDVREVRVVKSGNYRYSYPMQGLKEESSVDYTEMSQSSVKPIGGTFAKVMMYQKKSTGATGWHFDQRVEV